MNYGSLGSLSRVLLPEENFEFAYSREVFSAFSLNHESKLHGLYYPCPQDKEDQAYREATLQHDFVITPIPPELWKASARIHIYLKNRPGNLNEICEFFKKKGVSIIHSESTRSAYRYATWSLHVVFEKLIGEELEFDQKKSCYVQTFEELREFKKQLESEKKEILCFLPSEHGDAVRAHPNYTLSYFANYIDHPPVDNPLPETFSLRVSDLDRSHRKQRLIGDDSFKKLVRKLANDRTAPLLLPAITFSEIDSNELNLRTTLIPENESKRFFKVSIKYEGRRIVEATKRKETYVGIMHDVTKLIPSHYNIWHSYDRTIDNEPFEKGEIVFLMENIMHFSKYTTPWRHRTTDTYESDDRDVESYQQEVIKWFEKIGNEHNAVGSDYFFYEFAVSQLPTSGATKEIFSHDGRENSFEYDVFISYSQKDDKADENKYLKKLTDLFERNGISYHKDTQEIRTGDRLDQALLNNIRKSREVCIVVSANTMKSDWMTVERGAAWVLEKTITPYIANGHIKRVAQMIGMNKSVKADDEKSLNEYINDIIERKDKWISNKYRYYFSK